MIRAGEEGVDRSGQRHMDGDAHGTAARGAWRVRPVAAADDGAWLRMRCALWPEGATAHAAEIQQFFAGTRREPRHVLLVLDAGGIPVGFVELSLRAYAEGCVSDRVAYVEGWYVEPHARRLGAGAALIRAAEDWGRSQGCIELGSDAVVENILSARAHRALGFSEVAVIRCFRKFIGAGIDPAAETS